MAVACVSNAVEQALAIRSMRRQAHDLAVVEPQRWLMSRLNMPLASLGKGGAKELTVYFRKGFNNEGTKIKKNRPKVTALAYD
jgi:hypothetical protein